MLLVLDCEVRSRTVVDVFFLGERRGRIDNWVI